MNKIDHAYTYETLLPAICSRLERLFAMPYFCQLLQMLQLVPEWLLDSRRTCYLPDEVAACYWETFDPQQMQEDALDRCIVAQLYEKARQAAAEEQNGVRHFGKLWLCYPLEELLRLVWRCRDKTGVVRCYLHRYGQRLADPVCLRIGPEGRIRLLEGRHEGEYTMSQDEKVDYACFRSWAQETFLLVTEDFGGYVPEYIWMEYIGFEEE